MGLLRKKNKDQKPPQPLFGKLINLAILIFVVVMILNSLKLDPKTDTASTTHECAEDKARTEAERATRASLRSYHIAAAELHALDVLRMAGKRTLRANEEVLSDDMVACGQTVTYQLSANSHPQNKPDPAFATLLGQTKTWRTGDVHDEYTGLLQLLSSGQGVGNTGEYAFSRNYLLQLLVPGTPVGQDMLQLATVRMHLLKATPPAPKSTVPSTIIEVGHGSHADRVICGMKPRIQLRSWKLDGSPMPLGLRSPDAKDTPRFTSNVLELESQIGSGQLPYGIERAVQGLGSSGIRMVVLPPEFMVPFPAVAKDAPHVAFANASEILLVEVSVLNARQKAPEAPQTSEKTQGTAAKAAVDNAAPATTIPASDSSDTPISTPSAQ